MTCRLKIAKSIPICNPRWPPWPPSWKCIFHFFSWTERQLTCYLVESIKVTCRSKIAKSVPIRNPRCLHLENLFFTSSPESKGQLTWNSVESIGVTWGSIGMTCRSKIAKIVPIRNRRCRHLETLFFTSSPESKGQLTWNLVGSIGVTCRSNIAKFFQIWNPRWPPKSPSFKSILNFFSWTERPTDLKLDRK